MLLKKIGLLVMAAIVVIAGCTSTPEPTWSCYTYNFVESNENADGVPINIIKGMWVDGQGLSTVLDELIVNWQEDFYVNPRQIKFSIMRIGAGDIDVLYEVSAFAYNFGGANTLPSALGGAEIDNTNPSLSTEGRTVNATLQTTGALYVRSMTVYTETPTPFPRNDCDTTPTDTPSPTPTGTWTTTPTPTSTPLLTPSVTPDCFTTTWGGGDIYPAQIDKFSGGSGQNWVGGSLGYTFFAHSGTVITIDTPDGYIKRGIIEHVGNTGNPGNFHIGVGGVEFQKTIASCSSGGGLLICDFYLPGLGYTNGINTTQIEVWGSRGTGEGANPLRPSVQLRKFTFEFCNAPAGTATYTPSPTRTPSSTPSNTPTRTPVGVGSTHTPTATGINNPQTGTPTPTRTPSSTAPPPPATNTNVPPPPSSTALPTSTWLPTSTLISVPTFATLDPSAEYTGTAFSTYGPPNLTPIPGTPSLGTLDIPGMGTLASTPVPGETNIAPPDDLGDFHGDVTDNLRTAVAQVNALPRDLRVVMPQINGMYEYVGQVKWVTSGVSLQEIFGRTVYPVPQHMFYAITVVIFVSFIMIAFRIVMWAIKLALWIVRFILKIIPFIG